jgi:hypothetical protein
MGLSPVQKLEAATIYAMMGTCHKQLEKLYTISQDPYIGEAFSDLGTALRQINIAVKSPTPKPSQESGNG